MRVCLAHHSPIARVSGTQVEHACFLMHISTRKLNIGHHEIWLGRRPLTGRNRGSESCMVDEEECAGAGTRLRHSKKLLPG